MLSTAELVFDTSTTMGLGQRERQEDAVASDFSAGDGFGFVVLADGMGGHAAGDVASKIVVAEVFSHLKLQSGDRDLLERRIGEVLERAAVSANRRVGHYSRQRPDATGMGATLLAPVFIQDRLYWVSVGDSPLYLFRGDKLVRLNENHALMSQIDYLVDNGIMDRDQALSHPDPSCLTSVLIGRDIAQLDCRTAPVTLEPGDILIVASDGLQTLCEDQIEGVLRFSQKRPAEEIGTLLMTELGNLNDPCQDNVSICVVKVVDPAATLATTPEAMRAVSCSRRDGNTAITLTLMARGGTPRKATGT
ncbi:serine/threonine-protein phosphatase [Ponticoccus sp. SC2-23]|uniref:PP2C family protein-serine/threonine phosphatase n=1 Tax=Alexandriicola marinus TaxID=2081710 RepID=UPI000FDAA215|nr:protein phosphatase 2C domain-containing protein [Alexandriicola marinus]MBM1218760.1 serine/threonine-protein phosphatase [Ponticoccus sp. SC6-9]MBM1224168.1 serine/threonine-protein phosphatase [Ponticoccus sp. SC6-15]MBM1230053.1 serine/threonine-protein phosphatase [Ponticoccus sp. SC6-38]MBM1233134.1 serine/threonine-protein phosphatase [Ponticoccus sp. SC6-45]MBM1236916.1 serine/threonine-protein phosphatase [Ponticoccus sp. SC6-49]MBM1242145.1 serine/threonine-protein phosphatase [P